MLKTKLHQQQKIVPATTPTPSATPTIEVHPPVNTTDYTQYDGDSEPSSTLQFQLNTMDDISEFSDFLILLCKNANSI